MNHLFQKFLVAATALALPATGMVADSNNVSSSTPKLSGVIFKDRNLDGLMQETEVGAAGVVVDLLNEKGDFVERVLSNDEGIYTFADLADGVYFLRFEFSPGFAVRSRGIQIGGRTSSVPDAKGVLPGSSDGLGPQEAGDYVFVPVPLLSPDSNYSFTRLQLLNPANFLGAETSPYTP